jgi:fatty acid desaturase
MDKETVLSIKKENNKMDRKYFLIALLVLAGLWAAIGFATSYFIKYFI